MPNSAAMSDTNVSNSAPSTPAPPEANGKPSPSTTTSSPSAKPRPGRPNYALIHARPLPLTVYPLPPIVLHDPLSLAFALYKLLSHIVSPPTSHAKLYRGIFSPDTGAVVVPDPLEARALWEQGFFGKGSLSRSEPTWLQQERRRRGAAAAETSEEVTTRRRLERERWKRDRALAEAEALETQRRIEAGEIQGIGAAAVVPAVPARPAEGRRDALVPATAGVRDEEELEDVEIEDQEHLQLSPEETFFLAYALGVLKVDDLSVPDLLTLLRRTSYSPAVPASALSADDPFLLRYVAYHHYRSLGWVVRDGVKFAVDLLLYERGPAFKHSAFAVVVVPAYSHPYWETAPLTETRRRKGGRDWTWLHCVNRVQNSVMKTLVLAYVEVPPPAALEGHSVGEMLARYKIRDFTVRRWSANRSR
jgi:tRNA-splicing endonuclease subunit Sen2